MLALSSATSIRLDRAENPTWKRSRGVEMAAPKAQVESLEIETTIALTQMDAELERLDARSDLILTRLEEKYYQILRDLRAKEKAAKAELREFHYASGETRRQVGEHLRKLTKDLEAALQMAASEIA
jgi:hypothetical protein